ncbi:DNA primase [Candidatus Deianiraea vastatrix]|uniref:DNA primase n=1 Tax=Candidatus Deianiraea vastatrix TaxID=2163644 RepID=A0A5B8XDZ2_9RICK|nr:DNA primase [Candidatus Deianiraea vastatrix]QED23528.1 DNA primase [Candidatus Deianiraea vastatrix]
MDFEDIAKHIKGLVRISSVISARMRLVPNGAGKFKANCPFHKEKTASFHVDDERGIYKCFGCGKGGDVINFIKDYDNISDFRTALESIAQISGIELPKSSFATKEYSMQKRVFEINEFILQFFKNSLKNSRICMDYIQKERKISDNYIDLFSLGYAPDSYSLLIDEMVKNGFSADEIISSGAVKQSNGQMYTIFRNRFIIPIFDASNRCVGFGGRSLTKDAMPKYINSFESVIFKKGMSLYNLANAKQISVNLKENFVILAEGYMDVIALCMGGFPAIAPLGTAVTDAQISLLRRYFSSVYVWLDADTAGQNAAFKTAKIILKTIDSSFNAFFISQNLVKDPDEYLQKFGKDAMMTEKNRAMAIYEFIWNFLSKDVDFKKPNEVASLGDKIKEITDLIENKNIKFEYIKYFKDKMYNAKFSKKDKLQQIAVRQSSMSKIDEISALIVYLVNLREDLATCVEFDFEIENEQIAGYFAQIMENGKIDDIDEIDIFKSAGKENICKDDRMVSQFARLCISYKIEKLQAEIEKMANSEDDITKKIQIMIKEKQILLEKLKNYPI